MTPTRRQVLCAAGGVLFPLPFLASLAARGAAEPPGPHPLVVVRPANGVAQLDGDEPERFWPRTLGPLTRDSLAGDADRALSVLADHADRLLVVRGTRFPFRATRELHAGGGNQLLTGARPGPPTPGADVMTYALGESIDNWIARRSPVNGGEPLTLFTGRRDGFGDEVMSYRGPLQLRPAEDDPWWVYQRLFGVGRPALAGSVNDLVSDQLRALLANPRLSADDRQRLGLHLDSVRDIEVHGCRLTEEQEAAMADLAGQSTLDEARMDVARLHCDLVALVLGCEQALAVTLQIGARSDATSYVVAGTKFPGFHGISHRNVDPAELPLGYPDAAAVHAAINRLHLGLFGYLLDGLAENGVLDSAVVVFTSDVATGSHRYDQIPWVIAGAGDGTLRQGAYVDAGDVTHDRLLNTLLTATGQRGEDGGPIVDFGDPSLTGGIVDAMLA